MQCTVRYVYALYSRNTLSVLIQLLGPYSVSKTALLGLTKTLSGELAPQGIRVNCIAPGIIETKFASAVSSLKQRVNPNYLHRYTSLLDNQQRGRGGEDEGGASH